MQQKESGQCNKGKYWAMVRMFCKIVGGCENSGRFTCRSGETVMHGRKSLEIQTPVLVIAVDSFSSSVRFKQSVSMD